MKTLKFKKHLVDMVLTGKKYVTWRLFDDKDIRVGDRVELFNKDTGEKFAEADVLGVREKKMGEIDNKDFEGHENFESEEEMYKTYRSYYGDRVNSDTIVKIIKFNMIEQSMMDMANGGDEIIIR